MAARYAVTSAQRDTIDRRMKEIWRQLNQRKGSPIDPGWLADELQQIIEASIRASMQTRTPDQIRALFTVPQLQVEMVRQLNQNRGWGFEACDFDQLGRPPQPPDDNPFAVVVLDCSLGSPEQTFAEARHAIHSAYRKVWRWESLDKYPDDKYQTHQMLPRFMVEKKRGLRWTMIDVGANRGIAPVNVSAVGPFTEALWLAYYSPSWVMSMNGEDVPYVWLPGCVITLRWKNARDQMVYSCQLVPSMGWVSRGLCFHHANWSHEMESHSVPVVLGVNG